MFLHNCHPWKPSINKGFESSTCHFRSWDTKPWCTQNQAEISRKKIKFGDLPLWGRSCLKQKPMQWGNLALGSYEPNVLVPCKPSKRGLGGSLNLGDAKWRSGDEQWKVDFNTRVFMSNSLVFSLRSVWRKEWFWKAFHLAFLHSQSAKMMLAFWIAQVAHSLDDTRYSSKIAISWCSCLATSRWWWIHNRSSISYHKNPFPGVEDSSGRSRPMFTSRCRLFALTTDLPGTADGPLNIVQGSILASWSQNQNPFRMSEGDESDGNLGVLHIRTLDETGYSSKIAISWCSCLATSRWWWIHNCSSIHHD